MRSLSNIRITPALGAAVLAALGACGHDAVAGPTATDASHAGPLPVLVDYNPTLSDAGALLYVANHPDVDLTAVTIAGTGESRCSAALTTTRELLRLAGRGDVPVACGPEEAVGDGHAWPTDWRAAAEGLLEPLGIVPEPSATAPDPGVSAPELIATTAAETDGLVIVALGPLTNVALAVADEPDLVDEVAMTYAMAGAVGVPGNAPGGHAEWNVYADPGAADAVVRSGLPLTLVPLDATVAMPADAALYRRIRALDSPVGTTLADLWAAASPWEQPGFSLWDELTAVLAVDPSLAARGPLSIAVVTDGTASGRTVPRADGHTVDVVGRPDRRAVEAELLAVWGGG